MIVIVLILTLSCLLVLTSRMTSPCPPPPLPPSLVVDRLGSDETTPLGVPTELIRTVYSVVEPPICTDDPDRPQAPTVPEPSDTRHILEQATRRMQSSMYTLTPGNVISSIAYIDTKGIGTYYVTCMLHESSTGITMRIALKARYRPGSGEPPAILNIRFDPQHADRVDGEPCRSGTVPSPEAVSVRPEI